MNSEQNLLSVLLQDEKNQLMTTNVWLWQVTVDVSMYKYWIFKPRGAIFLYICELFKHLMTETEISSFLIR